MSEAHAIEKARLEWQDTKPRNPDLRFAYHIAAKYQPSMERAIKAFFNSFKGKKFEAALARSIEKRGPGGISQIMDDFPFLGKGDQWETFRKRLVKIYKAIIKEAGEWAAEEGVDVPKRIRKAAINWNFKLDNPYTERYIQNQTTAHLTKYDQEFRELVRDELQRGFREGTGVKPIARAITTQAGLATPTRQQIIAQKRKNKERMIEELMDEGWTYEDAEDRAEFVATRVQQGTATTKVAERALLIARTESVRAQAEGKRESWQVAMDEGFIPPEGKKVWIAAPASLRTCKICRSLHGETSEDIIEGTYTSELGTFTHPAHPRCRCAEGLVFPEAGEED